uniref:Putative secreted peptide n=1 Tax=Anopheles braziliensis TaxID=58242 RepID=A0A2M3ZT93_9DIPT
MYFWLPLLRGVTGVEATTIAASGTSVEGAVTSVPSTVARASSAGTSLSSIAVDTVSCCAYCSVAVRYSSDGSSIRSALASCGVATSGTTTTIGGDPGVADAAATVTGC